MLPYVAIVMLPMLASGLTRRYPAMLAMVLVGIVFVVFMGLRDRVGPDWKGYYILHQLVVLKSPEQILTESEPLSFLLFWLDAQYGYGMALSNTVASAILVFGVIAFARTTPLPWLAFLAAAPYLMLVFGMSGIRQAMGVGITLVVLAKWREWGTVRKLAGVFFAAMFHTSAVLIALLVIAGIQTRAAYRIMAAIPLGAIVLVALLSSDQLSDNLEVYGDRYLGEQQVGSGGSLFHIGLIAVPGLIGFIYRKRLVRYVPFPDLFYMGLIGALVTLAFNFVSSTGASRLTLYLYFLPMMIYPALCCMQRPQLFPVMYALLSLLQGVLLILWLLTAFTAEPYLPYRSLLF